jgi:hypothetical protein
MSAASATIAPKHRAPSTSELLEDLTDAFPNERVTVGELLDRLENRAIGLLLLILALPMCIPNVPGISTVFGILLLAPSLQLLLGGKKLSLPNFMRAWTFPREGLRKAVSAAAPVLRRIEKFIRPRLNGVTHFPFTIFFGLQTLIMSLVLILPIPGGNWPPGMTISITALALLQRDGLLAVFSTLCATASGVAAYYFFKFGVFAARELGELLSSWLPGLF